MYGCEGENPQEGVAQLDDLIRARKLFAYGDLVDYWDHGGYPKPTGANR
jgi:alpha-amylase